VAKVDESSLCTLLLSLKRCSCKRCLTFFEKDEFISVKKLYKNLISGLLFKSPASFSLYQNKKENNGISLRNYSFMRNWWRFSFLLKDSSFCETLTTFMLSYQDSVPGPCPQPLAHTPHYFKLKFYNLILFMLTLSEWSVPSRSPVNSSVKLASSPGMLMLGLLKPVILLNIEIYVFTLYGHMTYVGQCIIVITEE